MSITARNVSKRFGAFAALDDVSVEAPTGSLVALLGPSGSGKTTLLRIIAGLEVPDAGTVQYLDDDITRRSARERNVGFVFQHYALFRHMTVFENVAFGLRVRKWPEQKVRERVGELLHLVRLEEKTNSYPAALSGGQRQRIALVRALAPQPKVLLLDEPFGALDAKVRSELRGWLRRFHDEFGVTSIFVTHDQEEAFEVADRIVVMNHGRVEQNGTPAEVFEHPANAFVMGFVGPVTRLGEHFIRPHDIEVRRQPNGTTSEAMVERLVHLGFEVRADLVLHDGQRLAAQLSRQDAEELELAQGQIVFVRPSRTRQFADAPAG